MIYFDNAATTFPKPQSVQTAVLYAMQNFSSPGRGGYPLAMAAAKMQFRCRQKAAELFDCEPEQVVFTFHATHALNLAIKTLVQRQDRVVVSGFEHNAVMRPLYAIGARVTVAGRKLFAPEDTISCFENALKTKPKAAICTHVSNVFGYRLPILEIAALCRQYDVPLIIDASQAAGIEPVSLRKTGAAFIAMPGHKGLYGAQGTGLLLCSRPPKPLLEGGTGSQSALQTMPDFLPDCAEAGTANAVGIHGLLAGMEFVSAHPELAAHEQKLLRQLADGLRGFSELIVFEGKAQTGVLSFVPRHIDCEQLAQKLADSGVAVRAGLHCAPLAHRSAGTFDTGTIRISFSYFNQSGEIEKFLMLLSEFL